MGEEKRPPVFAVLTGDLVDSTALSTPEREAARQLVISSLEELNGWHAKKSVLRGKPEIFRGDQWQALLAQPSYAFRAAVYLRAALISTGCDSRVSIGIGSVDRISRVSISRSDGDAFVRSGHGLDELKSDSYLAISLPDELDDSSGKLLAAIAKLSGALISGWSKRQAEMMCLAISPRQLTQRDIADELAISYQVVSKTLKASQLEALNAAVEAFETIDW